MFDMNMIQSVVRSIFQGSGSPTLSKQSILSRAAQIPAAQKLLPLFQQVPDRNDYTENSLSQEVQGAAQKQGAGGVMGKIRSKVGV